MLTDGGTWKIFDYSTVLGGPNAKRLGFGFQRSSQQWAVLRSVLRSSIRSTEQLRAT